MNPILRHMVAAVLFCSVNPVLCPGLCAQDRAVSGIKEVEGNQNLSTSPRMLTSGTVNLNSAPVPVINVPGKTITNSRISVASGEVVRFVGSQSYDPDGDPLIFTWTFGDGAVSHEPDPTHTYAASGTYVLTLTVDDDIWPQYPSNPFVISIQRPPTTERGGIIVADLDNDGFLDYAVTTKDDPIESETTRATIGVYAHSGQQLWVKDVDLRINKGFYGLPGKFGPAIAAADVDGDSETELLHLSTDDRLVIRNGANGEIERTLNLPPVPSGAVFWGQLQVVNLLGAGDREVILQADVIPQRSIIRNKFPWLTAMSLETGKALWLTDQYDGLRHGGFRAADLDNDGLDEVGGAVMIDHDGSRMNGWNYRRVVLPGHFDALYFADVKPDVPGIEVIWLEEAERHNDHVAVFNPDQVFFYGTRDGDEPQNAAVGNFDPTRLGLEIFCRSRFNFDQRPWVLDANGSVIAEWIMNNKKPAGWSIEGIEMFVVIDWEGGDQHFVAVKERHTEGDFAIIDAMTGEFKRIWNETASRIYVVDVSGDYREEIVVVNNQASEIRIYWNDALNGNNKPRYWRQNPYKRQKQNYNYYSP